MNIVSNTGPLIALAKVDQLPLLESLYSEVHIPQAVQRELLAKVGNEAQRLDEALATFIRVAESLKSTQELQTAILSLGAGEAEALVLAHQLQLPLVMDDQVGRQAARRLNIQVTGTIGVLLQAKQAGLISALHITLDQLRSNGYWLSDELIAEALRLADEA